MSKFKLPPISPLAGTTFLNFFRVLKGNHIAPKNYLKITLTFILVVIGTPFHWYDSLVTKGIKNNTKLKNPPLFILGHWRSGTTFLHNILTQDPEAGYVTTYQAVYPNNLKSKWLFKNFMRRFMPEERPGDGMKINVDYPQEDEYALSNITHQSFYHFFYFPSTYSDLYKRYVRFEGLSQREEENWKQHYRQMVNNAQVNTNGKRVVLKNPVNTGRISTLLDIFPNANFIFLIRNPIIVYLSTKKFFKELFPTLNLENFSEEEITNMILNLYSMILKDYISDRKQIGSNKIIEVRYEELQENPMSELENIYYKIETENFQALKPIFSDYLKLQKGHRKNTYKLSKKELHIVITKFDFAMNHWNYEIPEELEIIEE